MRADPRHQVNKEFWRFLKRHQQLMSNGALTITGATPHD